MRHAPILLGLLLLGALALWFTDPFGDAGAGKGSEPTNPGPRPVQEARIEPEPTRAVEQRTAVAADEASTPPQAPVGEAQAEPVAPFEGLSGRAVLVDGAPLAGVHVYAVEARIAALTDDEGRFLFERLPAGAVTLEVRAGERFEALDQATFEAGREDVELTIAAAEGWILGERGGASVPVRRARAGRVLADGSCRPLGPSVGGPGGSAPRLLLPVDAKVLVHAEDDGGMLAGFVHTPPAGGRVSVMVREHAAGLSWLEVDVPSAAAASSGARLALVLTDRATGERFEGRLPLGRKSSWPGLIPGAYRVSAALEPGPDDSGSTLAQALVPAAAELELEAERGALLRVALVPGGRLEVVLPELLQGLVGEPGPDAGVEIRVRPRVDPQAEPLPLGWRRVEDPSATVWGTRGPLPAGPYEVRVANAHVALWIGEVQVTSNGATRVDAR